MVKKVTKRDQRIRSYRAVRIQPSRKLDTNDTTLHLWFDQFRSVGHLRIARQVLVVFIVSENTLFNILLLYGRYGCCNRHFYRPKRANRLVTPYAYYITTRGINFYKKTRTSLQSFFHFYWLIVVKKSFQREPTRAKIVRNAISFTILFEENINICILHIGKRYRSKRELPVFTDKIHGERF